MSRHHDRVGWQAQLMRQRQRERAEQQRKVAQEELATARLMRFTTWFVVLLSLAGVIMVLAWLVRGHL